MNQNLKDLIDKIEMEVKKLGYSDLTIRQYKNTWNRFIQYSLEHGKTDADVSLINGFFSDLYNIDITNIDNLKKHHQAKYRSLIMLLNFDYYREYVCRPFPKTDNIAISCYHNEIIDKYISYCENELYNYPKTLKEKKLNTKRFIQFLENNNCTKIINVNFELIQNYLDSTSNKSIESRRRIFYVLRCFLKYLYIEKYLDINYSYKIPKLKNIKSKKVPTYLKTNEVNQLLNAINNDNPVNKRNYTMILMAAKLGLRISDIKNIKFENIDWENNELKIVQVKTKNPLVLPLTKEVGWAIIDYIKNYRPKTESKYIFVKHTVPYGKLADANILQGCFGKYFEMAHIETNNNERKGLHSLRHSFATTLLENDTPIEIISSLMGHSNTEVTNIYTKVDVKKLKECSLEVPNETI